MLSKLSSWINDLPVKWRVFMALAIFGVFLTIVFAAALSGRGPTTDDLTVTFLKPPNSVPLGTYRFAAVAADAELCSKAGTEIMAKGGSAVDGALAAALCTGVVHPQSAGIGGGFFATIWDQKQQKAYTVDARETAPFYSSDEFYKRFNLSAAFGPYSIAVPGEVAGYWEMHQRFGRLPWSDLFESAIELAERGIRLREQNFALFRVAMPSIEAKIQKRMSAGDPSPFREMQNMITNPVTGKLWKLGENFRLPKLAATFRRLATEGGPQFYNGTLADEILADLREAGSPISTEDLRLYRVRWRNPTELQLSDGLKLLSIPPPGSGPVMNLILNILLGFNMTKQDSHKMATYHRFVEATKFAFGQRMLMGDEDFVAGMAELGKNLSSQNLGTLLRNSIVDCKVLDKKEYLPKPPGVQILQEQGTSHISVIDANGNAVSLTSTINYLFGSGIVGRRTGIIFNNEMDDFSRSSNTANLYGFPPSPSNFIIPGKRPMSSMCPTIIIKQQPDNSSLWRPRFVLGASGGSRITSATAYVAARMVWFGEDPKNAIEAPRLHHQIFPDELNYEQRIPERLLKYLEKCGHSSLRLTAKPSIVQTVAVSDDGTVEAFSDHRKGGISDGF